MNSIPITNRQVSFTKSEGINLCLEGAACHVAYLSDLESGTVNRDETVVIFNTANGLKWKMPEL